MAQLNSMPTSLKPVLDVMLYQLIQHRTLTKVKAVSPAQVTVLNFLDVFEECTGEDQDYDHLPPQHGTFLIICQEGLLARKYSEGEVRNRGHTQG